jgi:pimeloyl-ACP methyl ester carboxylesterase
MAGLGSVAAAAAAGAAAATPTLTPTPGSEAARSSALAAATTTTTTTTTTSIETFELDGRTGLTRLRYSPTGYRMWMWSPPADALLQPPQQRDDDAPATTATTTNHPSSSSSSPSFKINWAVAGPSNGRPVVLVHGYGASAYHYRYNLPALAEKGFRVYACDLVGFGWSERSTELKYAQGRAWARQLADFVEGVVLPEYENNGSDNKQDVKVSIAGNSLGGYASMAAAAARPDLFKSVALLNSAGPFEEQATDKDATDAAAIAAAKERARLSAEEIASADGDVYKALDARQRRLEREAEEQARKNPFTSAAQRAGGALARAAKRTALFFAFQRAKQPQQIRDVLGMVYASKDPLDDELVASIVAPTADPRSAEVFALINGLGAVGTAVPPPPLTVDAILLRLQKFNLPLALVWGEKDPWITPARARQILALAPDARYYSIPTAGHCPHDDAPRETNAALAEFFSA